MSAPGEKKRGSVTGKRKRDGQKTDTDKASKKAAPLAPKDLNTDPGPSNKEQEGKRTRKGPEQAARSDAANTTHASTSSISAPGPSENYATLKVRTRCIYITDLDENERQREEEFIAATGKTQVQTLGIRSSFMAGPGEPSSSNSNRHRHHHHDNGQKRKRKKKHNIRFNIPAFGSFNAIYVELLFGENPKSAPTEVLLDTGSSFTWVNERAYQDALDATGAQRGDKVPNQTFDAYYQIGSITGELYKDRITFGGTRSFVMNQTFGVVQESRNPDAEVWASDSRRPVKGILGIGPRALNKNLVALKNGERKDLPTVVDNLKDQRVISVKKFGLRFFIMADSSGSSAGMFGGDLHLGAPKRSAYDAKTLKVIPATIKGDALDFFGLDLKLTYNGETVMEDCPGIIDTGSMLISLPGEIVEKYIEAIHRASGREEPVVKYNDTCRLYYIARKDFGLLKDLEFNFVKGDDAVFKFSPDQQIFPPLATQNLGDKDDLFLVFRKNKANSEQGWRFRLGMTWGRLNALRLSLLATVPAFSQQKSQTPNQLARAMASHTGATETATFASGCFWGTEHIFLKKYPPAEGSGVLRTHVGYTGGHDDAANPSYREVCTGSTGHAEAVRIEFDPAKLSYGELVEYFYRTHDPTTVDRQGPDTGSQYRSAIFYHSPEQKSIAEQVTQDVQKLHFDKRGAKTVTSIEPAGKWYDAEDYHQEYLFNNPSGYQCPTHREHW